MRQPEQESHRLLSRADQVVVAAIVAVAIVALVAYWLKAAWQQRELIHIESIEPGQLAFRVDINQARWPACAALEVSFPSITFTGADIRRPWRVYSSPTVDLATAWLEAQLKKSPTHVEELAARGAVAGISRSAMYRARHRLAVSADSGVWTLEPVEE